MFSRPNKVSDDRDLLNFTSNSTLNTDLKRQFEDAKTDRSGESTPSPFDLAPYHQKSRVTSKGFGSIFLLNLTRPTRLFARTTFQEYRKWSHKTDVSVFHSKFNQQQARDSKNCQV